MGLQKTVAMADITSAAANVGVGVSDMEDVAVFVTGTFVGTVQVEASGDGTNYAKAGTALTAPGIVTVPTGSSTVRCNCTAFTSGTIKSHVGGRDSDR